MSTRWLLLGRVSLSVVAAACSDPVGTDNSNAPPCTGSVSITVSSGTTPTFAWTPVCKVFLLLVEATGGADQWSVITDSTNGLAPPITYGNVPAGARLNSETPSLASGTPYTVYLFRWTGPGRQDGVRAGTKPFTP